MDSLSSQAYSHLGLTGNLFRIALTRDGYWILFARLPNEPAPLAIRTSVQRGLDGIRVTVECEY